MIAITFQLCSDCAKVFRGFQATDLQLVCLTVLSCPTCRPRLELPTLQEMIKHAFSTPDLPTVEFVERLETAQSDLEQRLLKTLDKWGVN